MLNLSIRAFRKELRALEHQVELAFTDHTDCCSVSPAQCHLLLAVDEVDEASVGELASSLELDASTLSRTVDGLVKSEFLVRREDPANRRRQLVCLTVRGREKVDLTNDTFDRYYEGLLDTLPAEEANILLKAIPLLVKSMRTRRLTGRSETHSMESRGSTQESSHY